MSNQEFVIGVWERGTAEDRLTDDIKRDAEIIRQHIGADTDSPVHWIARGFMLGVMEGLNIYNMIEQTAKENAPA